MFGLEVIERLLPHRPPFLMVEWVVSYTGGEVPALEAEQPVRRSDPLFAYFEPPLYWPAANVIEGLGQSCNLLSLIWMLERRFTAKGLDLEQVFRAPAITESGDGDDAIEPMFEVFGLDGVQTFSRTGLLASVDVEVMDRACAGELLRYEVRRSHVVRGLSRFVVCASVGERVIVRGTLVGALPEGTA